MKKLLILGAGVYQVPLIKKAREMGIYTIVVSIPGSYPGFDLADKVHYVDTADFDGVYKVAVEEKIDGACVTGTDVAVLTLGKLCDALNLHGVSGDAAAISCSKYKMKLAFADYSVNTAEFEYVPTDSSIAALETVCERLTYPVIFKAIDSSGSRGIANVPDRTYITEAIEVVRGVTRSPGFIIERFIKGEEFGAQAFVQNGKLEHTVLHGDYVVVDETGVPVGHYAPYDAHGMETQVIEQLRLAVKAMQIDNCALNADFIYSEGKIYLLEIGARAGATCLAELVSIYNGYDYYEKMIRVALGEHVDFTPCNDFRVASASKLLTSDRDGVIVSQVNGIKNNKWVYETQFDYKVGDSVNRFRVGPNRLGHVIATGDTLEAAVKHLNDAMLAISIVVE